MDIVTKMVVVNSSRLLPSDVAIKLYELGSDVMVKETCYGILVSGERSIVDPLLLKIRKLDPYGIFIKERGFSPGERFRCRATRRGGAKPGFHNLEKEDKILPYIATALKALNKGEMPVEKKPKKKIDIDKFKEIIKQSEESK